jgi:hypothetical protein
VRYRLVADALPRAYACHCHQCQRWSGSAFSLNAIVPEPSLTVSGPVEVYELTTQDRISTQRFCAKCRSRIFNTNTRRPGFAVLRAGTLDRSEELECVAHIYTEFRQSWLVIPEGTPSWPQAAPPGEFVAVLMGTAAAESKR